MEKSKYQSSIPVDQENISEQSFAKLDPEDDLNKKLLITSCNNQNIYNETITNYLHNLEDSAISG